MEPSAGMEANARWSLLQLAHGALQRGTPCRLHNLRSPCRMGPVHIAAASGTWACDGYAQAGGMQVCTE